MESRLIHIVSQRKKVEWLNPTRENGAWIYIGNGAEMKRELILNSINDHFTDDTLYVSWTRNGSKEILKANIEFEIEDILGNDDFKIWDTDFCRVIEFNKIGVMRLGEAKN